MTRTLKILHLEDMPDDAEMVARELEKSDIKFDILHVDTRDDFIRGLKEFSPEIVLSDHSLPSFDSHEALAIVKRMGIAVPFILITATVSEDYAVSIIKEGAADYILKDRLQRLPSAIVSTLEKYNFEIERRRSEEKLRTSEREKLQAEAALARQRLLHQKLITEASIQVQEREREELGKELHDNINQILATSKLYLQQGIKKDNSDSVLLQKSREYIDLAIQEIRKLTRTLVAPSLGDITLTQAISELIELINGASTIEVELDANDYEEEGIDKNISLMFYRIVQEQINNILKHSQAKKVTIRIASTTEAITLVIKDNGIGFDTNKTPEGIGLRNITSRVGFYSGTMKVISAPGEGCVLEVGIPVKGFEWGSLNEDANIYG